MTWMWVAGGILAGLYVYSKNKENRKDAEKTRVRMGSSACSDANEKREIREAVTAGEHALDSLHAVMERLDSARAWGVCDMLGAGIVSSKYKYSKIDDANEWVQLANNDLRTFAKELGDVTSMSEYIRPGVLVSSMDPFCSHLATDAAVQKRIHRAMTQIDSLIVQVGETVDILKKKIDD